MIALPLPLWARLRLLASLVLAAGIVACSHSPNGLESKQLEEAATHAYLSEDWKSTLTSGLQWEAKDQHNPIVHFLLNQAYTYTDHLDQAKVERSLAFGSQMDTATIDTWTSDLVRTHSSNPYAYVLKGLAQEESDDNSGAVQSYEQAIALKTPRFTLAYNTLGNLYLSSRQPDKALATYRLLSDIDPTDASAYVGIGTTYAVTGDVDQAIAAFEKACELNPNDLVAHYNLGYAYLDKGLGDMAKKAFERVVQLNPSGETGKDARAHLLQLSQ